MARETLGKILWLLSVAKDQLATETVVLSVQDRASRGVRTLQPETSFAGASTEFIQSNEHFCDPVTRENRSVTVSAANSRSAPRPCGFMTQVKAQSYFGVPVRDASDRPIAGLAARSRPTRIWSARNQTDQVMFASLTERVLAKKDVSTNDAILSLLAS